MGRNREYPLTHLYFYLTEGCNLRCRHCWLAPAYQPAPREDQVLSPSLFSHILDQAGEMGLHTVKLTGGEPLLHPSIREFIEQVHRRKFRLVMETNGVLCTPGVASELASGEDNAFVSVSLDGAEAETHEYVRGVKGCFEAALAGIRNLVEVGIKPQVIMAVMRRNAEQMEKVVRLAETLGAGSVKFNPVMPTERGRDMHLRGDALSVPELVDLGRRAEMELASSSGVQVIYHQPPSFRPLSRLFDAEEGGCVRCGLLSILGVLADGSYALCGIGASVPELVFGHAERTPLREVWANAPKLEEIRACIPEGLEGVCHDCLHRGMCLGSCIAQNYYTSRSLTSPFWFCSQAREAGIFPASRLKSAMSEGTFQPEQSRGQSFV